MLIVSAFTSHGVPATGLTPALTVYRLSDDAVVVNAQAMSEVANGLYKYDFAGYVAGTDYAVFVDGGASLTGNDRYQYGSNEQDITHQIWEHPLEDVYTVEEALRLVLSAVAGKASGGGTTTVTFRDTADGKDRIVMTVDANGNRSAVALDAGL